VKEATWSYKPSDAVIVFFLFFCFHCIRWCPSRLISPSIAWSYVPSRRWQSSGIRIRHYQPPLAARAIIVPWIEW
jgi:hypothetical protein